jgi:outer membrane protein
MIRAAARAGLLAGIALVTLPAMTAHAEDLRDALVSAYRTNPTLQGARANQRANDENVAIEKADGRPSADAKVQHTEFLQQSSSSFIAPKRLLEVDVSASVPIYSGGAVRNGIKAAKTRVEAGQADLRGTESSIFSQVVGAYMDVILNEAVVGLNRNNIQVLSVNLQATSDRYEIGDLTRTDVAQSQARLALARGDTRTAEANLSGAREHYIQLVGKAPGELEAPPPLPGLPATPEEAMAVALDNNPDILASRERSKAAGFERHLVKPVDLELLQQVLNDIAMNPAGKK